MVCLHLPHGCCPTQALLSTRARCAPLLDPHMAGALLPAWRLHLPGSPPPRSPVCPCWDYPALKHIEPGAAEICASQSPLCSAFPHHGL